MQTRWTEHRVAYLRLPLDHAPNWHPEAPHLIPIRLMRPPDQPALRPAQIPVSQRPVILVDQQGRLQDDVARRHNRHPGRTSNLVARATAPAPQGVLAQILGQEPAPYSNPTRSYALPAPTVAPGFQPVWDDGRLNTQHGIRRGPQTQSPSGMTGLSVRYATAPRPQAVQAQTPRVATRTAPQTTQRTEQLSGHRYVQVGTFATHSQAQSVAQSLRACGLPMRIGVFDQNRQEMRMVLAGPFGSDNQLQGALGTARGAGFSGAFTRR
jgi:cell division septation protein DedD